MLRYKQLRETVQRIIGGLAGEDLSFAYANGTYTQTPKNGAPCSVELSAEQEESLFTAAAAVS